MISMENNSKMKENKRSSNIFNMKNKKGSNGMVQYNLLTRNYDSNKKYLNILVASANSHAAVAEWLTQSADTRCPFGVAGSIPTSSLDLLSMFQNTKVKTFASSVTLNSNRFQEVKKR